MLKDKIAAAIIAAYLLNISFTKRKIRGIASVPKNALGNLKATSFRPKI